MDEAAVERLLAEQRRYYRERRAEFDDWWLRRWRLRTRHRKRRPPVADVRELDAALDAFGPRGDVLELAAVTDNPVRALVVRFKSRQRAAGTRRVHGREHARSRADTAGTPLTPDLQDKRARE